METTGNNEINEHLLNSTVSNQKGVLFAKEPSIVYRNSYSYAKFFFLHKILIILVEEIF